MTTPQIAKSLATMLRASRTVVSRGVISEKLLQASWPKDQIFAAEAPAKGKSAHRTAVPEYYGASCLSCHGSPQGEIDITGYPKEGGKVGDLGGVISITLFK
jgi:cytochrome c5